MVTETKNRTEDLRISAGMKTVTTNLASRLNGLQNKYWMDTNKAIQEAAGEAMQVYPFTDVFSLHSKILVAIKATGHQGSENIKDVHDGLGAVYTKKQIDKTVGELVGSDMLTENHSTVSLTKLSTEIATLLEIQILNQSPIRSIRSGKRK